MRIPDLPLPTGTGRMADQIRKLQAEVKRLQPRRAAGTMITSGPSGTTIRSVPGKSSTGTGAGDAGYWI